MDCQFCTPTTTGHQDDCPAFVLVPPVGVQADVRECTCGQMPHRADCMVKTGRRPADAAEGISIEVDPCGCLAMLRGEVNAWLAEAATVEGPTKTAFLNQVRYLMGLVERAEQRHALQQALA
jgi:hypothetical protein